MVCLTLVTTEFEGKVLTFWDGKLCPWLEKTLIQTVVC